MEFSKFILNKINNHINAQNKIVKDFTSKRKQKQISGFERYIIKKLNMQGIPNEFFRREYIPEGLVKSVDLAIVPKADSKIKGIAIEVNGPTHFFMPALTELNQFTLQRIKLLEKAGFKVFSVPTYFMEDAGNEFENSDVPSSLDEIINLIAEEAK